MKSLADVVDANAARAPDAPAFFGDRETLAWGGYRRRSDRLAGRLAALGLARGDSVAVWLPDGPGVHVAWLAAEKAGLPCVGIGPRAGPLELRHLLAKTRAVALVSLTHQAGAEVAALVAALRADGLPLRHHLVVEDGLAEDAPVAVDGTPAPEPGAAPIRDRRLSTDEVFFINSTSGTTGLPKCVVHDQARWLHFHELAVEAGELSPDDVFLSALPAPFGFGIWTAHVTPALLGAPTALVSRFDAGAVARRIEAHRVTVLAAVSTQFMLLLDSPELDRCDVSSLRVLFTGGEAVPRPRAEEFERRTGARVLQFYGSNETGALSRTTLRDSRDVRLSSAGRVIPSMQVRLFDEAGRDATATGRGQPGCRGPVTSRGYLDDDAANAKLFTPDGWMLTGDIVTLDADGVLRVVGRVADFIIRGGKNVSAAEVEAAVGTHPAVSVAAAVAMPDRVFGERVCVYAELRPGFTLALDALNAHLRERGVSVELLPERLIVLDALPRASGGKIAKGELRADIQRRSSEAT